MEGLSTSSSFASFFSGAPVSTILSTEAVCFPLAAPFVPVLPFAPFIPFVTFVPFVVAAGASSTASA